MDLTLKDQGKMVGVGVTSRDVGLDVGLGGASVGIGGAGVELGAIAVGLEASGDIMPLGVADRSFGGAVSGGAVAGMGAMPKGINRQAQSITRARIANGNPARDRFVGRQTTRSSDAFISFPIWLCATP